MLEREDTLAIARQAAQIKALTRQLEAMALGADLVAPADTGILGFGPGASKTYKVRQGLSIGGYGEVLYQNFRREGQDGTPSGKADQIDALRGIVYVGYKFNGRFLFNSEIELEHASTGQAGSASLEFAYLDYRPSDHFGLRAGLLLSPMGFVNELHEPPVFLGATRSVTEQRIIPSTWRENGIGIFGEAAGFSYRAYMMNGLDAVGGSASRASGFSAAGIRGGRQKGSTATAEEFAAVARLDYSTAGARFGGSVYAGNSGQNQVVASNPAQRIGARTVIWEGHAEYRAYGLDFRGLVAGASVDEAALINEARQLSGSASVGERLLGWYVHVGYNLLRHARTDHELIPYVRYERINTQQRVPAGFAPDPANDQELISIGAAWRPIPNVVLKADYVLQRNEADTGVDEVDVALGYLF